MLSARDGTTLFGVKLAGGDGGDDAAVAAAAVAVASDDDIERSLSESTLSVVV